MDSRRIQRLGDAVTPVVISLLLVYGSWVYSYYICWEELRQTQHRESVGVGLIVGNIVLLVLLFTIWLQIMVLGPGVQPRLPPYRLLEGAGGRECIEPPAVFSCDERGYPVWCSNCQSIKAERAHHSTRLDRCVPRFDHYCAFIGCVIGKRNHRLFMQFCVVFTLYFVYIITSMGIYSRDIQRRAGSLNPNIVVCLVLAAVWLVMVLGLTGEHVSYLVANKATVTVMDARRIKKQRLDDHQYYSVSTKEGRCVVSLSKQDYKVWDHGVVANMKSVLGQSPWFWAWPVGSPVANTGNPHARTYDDILGDYAEALNEDYILRAGEVAV